MMDDTFEDPRPIHTSTPGFTVHRMRNYDAPWPYYHIAFCVRHPRGMVEAFFLAENDAMKYADSK